MKNKIKAIPEKKAVSLLETNFSGKNFLIYELIKTMSKVEWNTPETKLNTTTISDGKGGRILF